jgi:ribosome-binding protein aMBF1 (putative translation factor)
VIDGPRCGKPLRLYEWPGCPAVLDAPPCARAAGHKGTRHRSAAALAAARQRAAGQQPTGSPFIAAAIRQAREQAAMSRPRLAAVVGVSATAIQYWETARRTPSAEMWEQLELTLGPLGIVRDPGPEAGQEQQRRVKAA